MQLEKLQAIVDRGHVIVIVACYPRAAHTTVSYAVEASQRALEIIATLRRCGLKPNVFSVPRAAAHPPPSAERILLTTAP